MYQQATGSEGFQACGLEHSLLCCIQLAGLRRNGENRMCSILYIIWQACSLRCATVMLVSLFCL